MGNIDNEYSGAVFGTRERPLGPSFGDIRLTLGAPNSQKAGLSTP